MIRGNLERLTLALPHESDLKKAIAFCDQQDATSIDPPTRPSFMVAASASCVTKPGMQKKRVLDPSGPTARFLAHWDQRNCLYAGETTIGVKLHRD